MPPAPELRRWLSSQPPDAVQHLLAFLAVVHGQPFGYKGEPTGQVRASAAGMRSWVAKAPADLLLHIADVGRGVADKMARQHGFAKQGLRDADAERLRSALTSLPPSLACLALHWYPLSDEDTPERGRVLEHWDTLWEAAVTSADWPEPKRGRRASKAETTAPGAASEEARYGDPHSTRPEAADRGNVVSGDLAEQLESAAQRLRGEGEALAERLEGLAVDVRRGVGRRDADLSAAVDAWFGLRAATAELALGLGGDVQWAVAQTHDDLDRILADVRSAKVGEEIAAALVERERLVAMLGAVTYPGVRTALQVEVDAIDARLQELRSLGGAQLGTRPADATPPADATRPEESVEPAVTGGAAGGEPPASADAGAVPAAVEVEAQASDAVFDGPGQFTDTLDTPVPEEDREGPEAVRAEPAAGGSATGPERAPVGATLTPVGPAAAPRTADEQGGRPRPAATATAAATVGTNQLPSPSRPLAEPRVVRPIGIPKQASAEAEPKTAKVVEAPVAVEPTTDVWTRTGDCPSPVEQMVAEGRLAEAYWLTRAARERQERCQSLAFATSAFGLAPGQQAAIALQVGVEDKALPTAEDRDGYLIALAAAVRSGLQAGWALPIVNDFAQLPGLPEVWNELFRTLALEIRRGVSVQPGDEVRLGQDDTVDPADLRDRAEALRARLGTSKTAYQLASRVLQTLLKDDAELGHTLNLIVAWSVGGATSEQLRQDLEGTYGEADAIDRIIKETTRRVSSPNQRKTKIIATALDQLRGRIGEVTTLLREAVQVAEMPPRGDNRRLGSELLVALRAAGKSALLPGPGGEAVRLLLDWIGDGVSRGASRALPGLPGTDALLVLPRLAWTAAADGQDTPDLAAPDVLDALLEVLKPADPGKAFGAHLDRGDLHIAARLLDLAGAGRLGALPAPEVNQPDAWRRRLGDAEAQWRLRAETALRKADDLFAHVRLQNLLTPEQESHLAARLLDLKTSDRSLRFRHLLERVRDVVALLDERVSEKTDQLREQLVDLNLDGADLARISALIDRGDVATAEELLSFARKGDRIPEQVAETGTELAAFLEGVRHPESPRASSTGVDARWWFDHYARGRSGQAETDAVTGALEAWESLGRLNERRNSFQKHVPSVLRMLGLSVKAPVRLVDQDRKDWQVMTLSVTAEISDNVPGYVSRIGSRAKGSYRVLIVGTEELGPDALLRHLPESALGANIILYLQPLGISGRRRLAQASHQKPQQAIVVDPAVFGWIAAGEARSFRAVQRVTLPWAAYRPYEPFQAGQVAAEVFKGRDDEKRTIMAREGGLFLYGGRQLGKSSLLRQVAESFRAGHGGNQVAVYTDLRFAEIGLSRLPQEIWSVLAQQLKAAGVLDRSVSEHASATAIGDQIQQWLNESEERRILFLADEADAFLNADARPVETAGAQSTFRTLTGLMKLMADTERRFKIVFAGLHQVQRYNRLTNSITGHGGEPVLVGPLRAKAAIDLVVEPLAAAGLFFENPDLVWSILALTNNQANLVQIVCEGLVEEMQGRALSTEGGRPRITNADVQKVVAKGGIRDKIRDRLRLTIDLEDRYRVLTLILALRSLTLTDGYARGYTPQELQEEAHRVWPDGFPEQNGVDEVRTDLVEMEGLGLVLPLPGRSNSFVMRSPNLVNMLGTRDELEAELRTSEFTQKYDYNPRVARRSIGVDSGRVMRMSPLTDEQWHDALSRRAAVITASAALGADSLAKAAEQHVGRECQVVSAAPAELTQTVTRWARERSPHLIFVDLRGVPAADVRAAVERLAKYASAAEEEGKEIPRRRALAVVDPLTALGPDFPEVSRAQPQRWNATSLRAWPEQPFVSVEERRNLIEVTGGWPAFVERAIAQYLQGAPRERLFDATRALTDDPDFARSHLRRVGLSDRRVEQMAGWADMFSPEEHRQGRAHAVPQDLAVVLDDDLDEAEALLADLEALGVLDDDGEVLTVDSVTFRALKAVAGAQGGPV
ncbi:hypothetical protein ACFY4B_07600 [Kitasatospora sp. NPDC001261]|uniref:hypothetical protein n=1 Tax=Kitasatospora sp. NPDC001261 TaxID=3364012 RepID=UPI0036BBB364